MIARLTLERVAWATFDGPANQIEQIRTWIATADPETPVFVEGGVLHAALDTPVARRLGTWVGTFARVTDRLGHPNAIRHDPVFVAALGEAPDIEVAARFGVTRARVSQLRRQAGIPAFTRAGHMSPRERARADRSVKVLLGKYPHWSDIRIAQRAGVANPRFVRTRRAVLGIAPHRMPTTEGHVAARRKAAGSGGSA